MEDVSRRIEALEGILQDLVTDEAKIFASVEEGLRRANRLALFAIYVLRAAVEFGYLPKEVMELAQVRLVRDLSLLANPEELGGRKEVKEVFGDDSMSEDPKKAQMKVDRLERYLAEISAKGKED